MHDSLEAKIEKLRTDEPLRLEAVDFNIKNPKLVREELGRTFNYFARVEGEVACDPLIAMMPRLGTEYKGYKSHGREFIKIWVEQEQAHGQIFEQLQRKLNIEPAKTDTSTTIQNRIGGFLGRISPSLHGVMELTYLTRGAMHEKLTFIGYEKMAERLIGLGEVALHETIIRPIRRQESGHLGYYKQAANELKSHLDPWQIRLAKRLSIATYAPVGAGSNKDKPDFGHVAETLVGDHMEAFALPIQKIAENLLSLGEPEMPHFVLKSLRQCIDAERAVRASS